METFYDTHAHLDFPEYADDLDAVLDRAKQAGIRRLVTIGCDLESSRRAVALAERLESVYAAVGWHPGYVEPGTDLQLDALEELAQHEKVVAIGECGLDYFRLNDTEPAERERIVAAQKVAFRAQLELAARRQLNCIVHQRTAWQDTLDVWDGTRASAAERVDTVFHCFVGTPEEAAQVVERGGYISFTGILTFKSADTVRRTAASVPCDRYFLETDCPFLAPTPYRGKRCEPAHVLDIAKVLAGVRNTPLGEIGEQTCANADRFFFQKRSMPRKGG